MSGFISIIILTVATVVLKKHIVKGYTVNEQRLRGESAKLQAMGQTMELLARTLAAQELVTETGRDVLKVITGYAYALNRGIVSECRGKSGKP